MGLELVEFAMAVEARFEVRIPDDDAARAGTLGEVRDAVWRAMSLPDSARQAGFCASQRVLHLLRDQLCSRSIAREAVSLDVPLDELLARAQWQELWREVERGGGALELRMPPLAWPAAHAREARRTMATVGAASAFTLGPLAGGAVTLAAAASVWGAGSFLRVPAARTLRTLVEDASAHNYGRLVRAGARWRDDEALDAVLRLAAEQFDVPRGALKADTRLLDLAPYG